MKENYLKLIGSKRSKTVYGILLGVVFVLGIILIYSGSKLLGMISDITTAGTGITTLSTFGIVGRILQILCIIGIVFSVMELLYREGAQTELYRWVSGGSMVFLFIMLMALNSIFKIAMQLISGNYLAILMSYETILNNISDPHHLRSIFVSLAVGTVGVSLWLWYNDTHRGKPTSVETAKNNAEVVMDKAKESVKKIDFSKIDTKLVKKVLIAISVVAVVFVGYRVWDTQFNKLDVDLFSHVEVGFSGVSDQGVASIQVNAPETTNSKVIEFLSNVRYEITPSYGLSNGDVVTVSAIVDNELANKLKIRVGDASITATVEALNLIPQSASEIKNLDNILIMMREGVNPYLESKSYTGEVNITSVVDRGTYFRKASDYQDNCLRIVYEYHYEVTYSFSKEPSQYSGLIGIDIYDLETDYQGAYDMDGIENRIDIMTLSYDLDSDIDANLKTNGFERVDK